MLGCCIKQGSKVANQRCLLSGRSISSFSSAAILSKTSHFFQPSRGRCLLCLFIPSSDHLPQPHNSLQPQTLTKKNRKKADTATFPLPPPNAKKNKKIKLKCSFSVILSFSLDFLHHPNTLPGPGSCRVDCVLISWWMAGVSAGGEDCWLSS